MRIKFITILFLIVGGPGYAQHEDCATTEFTISGEVEQAITVTGKSLDSFTAVPIKDIIITNHKGEVRKTATGLKGILLKSILDKAIIKSNSPKTLSEYYFIFTACDGYKVVYSWNEIFNSATGNNIYLVTEKDGNKGEGIKDGMVSVTITDDKTGRRYVKGLATIIIKKAE